MECVACEDRKPVAALEQLQARLGDELTPRLDLAEEFPCLQKSFTRSEQLNVRSAGRQHFHTWLY